MNRLARAGIVALSLGACALAHDASAQAPEAAASAAPAPPLAPTGQGVAVLAVGNGASDEAFQLARAVYGSRLRPRSLDEVRARVIAGGPVPPNASRELRDLAEIRAGITTEDAAGRRLLAGLAQQVGAEALLVVRAEPSPAMVPPPAADADGGVAADAGNGATASPVVARLFLASSGDFDAARYSPETEPGLAHTPAAWKSTVVSLEARFPGGSAPSAAVAPTPPQLEKDRKKESGKSPFYASAWFWGSIAGAALLGTAFYFASRDTDSSTIHLQMNVPR